MNSLNSVLLEGIVTKAPVASVGPNGTPLCTFEITSSRTYISGDTKAEELSVFELVAWESISDACIKNCTAGRGVRIVGRLKQGLEDFEGKTISRVYVVAEHIEFKPNFMDKKGE